MIGFYKWKDKEKEKEIKNGKTKFCGFEYVRLRSGDWVPKESLEIIKWEEIDE